MKLAQWALALPLVSAAWCQNSYDLVVYGGTPGGGMVSGGLSRTDVGRREVIGGYALEFYWRAGNAYNMAQHLQDVAWLPEPHVAEAIFRQMLQDAGVK